MKKQPQKKSIYNTIIFSLSPFITSLEIDNNSNLDNYYTKEQLYYYEQLYKDENFSSKTAMILKNAE